MTQNQELGRLQHSLWSTPSSCFFYRGT